MRVRTPSRDCLAVSAAASRLLQYPDENLLCCLDDVERLVQTIHGGARGLLLDAVRYLRANPVLELQASYVETFDLHQGNCLYLTYARSGDTRGRGQALWQFEALYRRRGCRVSIELQDFLPALLELVAESGCDDLEPFEMLIRYRPEIAVLRASLQDDHSPYADVVVALEAVLPRAEAAVSEAARRLIEEGPPEERVGIAPDFVWQSLGCTSDELEADALEARR